ncbi:hypothetical protein [Malonomonas rubra]|uniref:hypothetical protein n=1 Tax=Malonomonas rubra TaxID=57040 RepID=UPI0026EC4213|nr:hypothetical protein [Malonomonas rubra]
MKTAKRLMMAVTILLASSLPVLAEAGAREDSSNVLVWAFLGICGLIIFLQMVPILSMAYGLIKGIFGKKEELEAATSKYR